MRRNGVMCAGLLALAAVALLALPDNASAQRRRDNVSVGVNAGPASVWVGNRYYAGYNYPYNWNYYGYNYPYYSSSNYWGSPYYSSFNYPAYSSFSYAQPRFSAGFGTWPGAFAGAPWGYSYPEYYIPGQMSTETSTTSGYAPNDQAPAGDKAYAMIQIPAESADVWIQGEKEEKFTQTNPSQEYVSPQVTPGKKYFYQVRARWHEGNRTVEETRNFAILPGRPVVVDFTQPLPPQQGAGEAQQRSAPAPRENTREQVPQPKR